MEWCFSMVGYLFWESNWQWRACSTIFVVLICSEREFVCVYLIQYFYDKQQSFKAAIGSYQTSIVLEKLLFILLSMTLANNKYIIYHTSLIDVATDIIECLCKICIYTNIAYNLNSKKIMIAHYFMDTMCNLWKRLIVKHRGIKLVYTYIQRCNSMAWRLVGDGIKHNRDFASSL